MTNVVYLRFQEIIDNLGSEADEEIDSKLEEAINEFVTEFETEDHVAEYKEMCGSEAEDLVLDDLCFNVEDNLAEDVKIMLRERFPTLDA